MNHRGAMRAGSEGLSAATPLETFPRRSHRVAMPARWVMRRWLASLRDAFMRRAYEGCRCAQPLATGFDGSAINDHAAEDVNINGGCVSRPYGVAISLTM